MHLGVCPLSEDWSVFVNVAECKQDFDVQTYFSFAGNKIYGYDVYRHR